MAYIAPVHGASSIRHAIKLRLMNPREDSLVVAKSNRLEVYSLGSDGLSLEHNVAIWGKPVVLEKLIFPPSSVSSGSQDARDHLFVATDRQVYFTLSWDQTTKRLKTEKKYVDVSDPSSRLSQTGDRALIDPTRRFMTLEIYEGIVTVIPIMTDKEVSRKRKHSTANMSASGVNGMGLGQLRAGDLGEPSQCRIEEMLVRSSTFLYKDNELAPPRLALLFEDSRSNIRVKIRELKVVEKMAELRPVNIFQDTLEAGSNHLIPVPSPLGGMLVLGESSIKYMNDRTQHTVSRSLNEPTVFTCWEQVDGRRWILADDYCRLYFLMLSVNNEDGSVCDWKIDCLGFTSHAATMVYLGDGFVFIGSHQGDSEVIRITEGSFKVMQRFANLAPILDFAIMNLGSRGEGRSIHEFSSGQARIVTGSGAFLDGSLRSVRSGVGMDDIGIIGDMKYVTDIWGLRCTAGCDPGLVDTLVVSFVSETRVFRFLIDGDIEEMDLFLGLPMEQSTLLAANLPRNRVMQVSENKAIICPIQNQTKPWMWEPSSGQAISAAAINDQRLVLVVDGRFLHAFDLTGAEVFQSLTQEFPPNEQISGVTLSSEYPNLCIICHPQTAKVVTADLEGKHPASTVLLGTPGDDMPRSAIIAQILSSGPPTVFIAMADGNVFSYSLDIANFTLTQLSRVLLSSEPASFKKLPRADGTYNIFAACEQPSLIYASEGRIIYSAVDCEPGTRICHFNTESYPGSVAAATPSQLKIAEVDSERTTQVRTLPVGETVYRMTYSQAERAFGLGTIKRDLQDGVEIVTSHFVLADEILFRKLNVYDLNPDELVSSVISFSLTIGQDALGNDITKDVFAVGTAYADAVGSSDVNGRIILFEVTENRELDVLVELPLRGSCRALAVMEDNKLVAALIKSVVVYDIFTDRFGDVRLSKKAAYRTSTAPTDIAVTGDIIAVSDLMKSVSLIQYRPMKEGEREGLVEIARHNQTVWSTCVANIDENAWLQGDAEGNLVILGRNLKGVTPADEKRMVVLGEVHLGEMVNRVKPVSVQVGDDTVVTPRAFMATVDGSIYLLGLVNPRYQDLLMRLQAGMANIVTTPGRIPFNTFRGFRNQVRRSDEPYRFVDGELVERFLELPSHAQKNLVESLNTTAELARTEKVSVAQVRDIMEELRRMH